MARIKLQPTRRFAILALAAHLLAGGAVWWWLAGGSQQPATSPVVWMSPADFIPAVPQGPPVAKVSPEPRPVPQVESDKKLTQVVQPNPAAELNPGAKSMLAVVGTEPPSPPVTPPHFLPKAVPIDPAQALALMKGQEAAGAKTPAAAAPSADASHAPAKIEAASAAPPGGTPSPPVVPGSAQAPKSGNTSAVADLPVQATDVSRFITVSRLDSARSHDAMSLLDVASSDAGGGASSARDRGEHLEEVDRAICNALLRHWTPPEKKQLTFNQRTAHMDMAVDRSGHVLYFKLVQRSGSEAFDDTVRAAANRLTTIQASLPDSFHQDRYEFQLHFHVD